MYGYGYRLSWDCFDRAIRVAAEWVSLNDDEEALKFWDNMRYIARLLRRSPLEQKTQHKKALENKYKGFVPLHACSLHVCKFCWRLVPAPSILCDIYCDDHSFVNNNEDGEGREESSCKTSGAKHFRSRDKRYRRKVKLRQLPMSYGFQDVDAMALVFHERLYGRGWGKLEIDEKYSNTMQEYDSIKSELNAICEKNLYPEPELLLKCLPEVSRFLKPNGISVSSMFELGDALNIISYSGVESIYLEKRFKSHFEVIDCFARIESDKLLSLVDDKASLEPIFLKSKVESQSLEDAIHKTKVIDIYCKCFSFAEAWLFLDAACKHGGVRQNAGRKRKL